MTVSIPEPAGSAVSLADKITYAQHLADSNMLSKSFVRQPANVLVAIEYGDALGIRPIVALSEINVINGTPALSASLMVALARQAGHKVRIYGDAASATCEIVRADDPDFTHTFMWDEKKARAAGLWGRGHWMKDPGTMLKWRAASEGVRFACSEVLGGLKYSTDEVHDFKPEPAEHHVTQQQPAQRQQRPMSPADIMAQAPIPAPAVDWIGRVGSAETDDQLRQVWTDANTAGALDPNLNALITARREDILAAQVDTTTGEVFDAEIVPASDVDPWADQPAEATA